MPLEDLKKRIYNTKVDDKLTDRLDYKIEKDIAPPTAPKPFLTPRVKKWLKISLGSFFITLLIAIVVILNFEPAFSQDKVFVEWKGSQKIQSGEFLQYDFNIKNSNGVALTNARLIVEYPLNSRLQNPERPDNQDVIDIGRISSKSEQNVSSYVRIFGPEDSKKIVNVKLEYIPASISSKLEKALDFAVDIITSPIKIIIDEPKIITTGKELTYNILLSNQSTDSYKDFRLFIEYPEGFVITKFSPETPSIGNHTWQFDELMSGEEKEFKITGKLTKQVDIVNLIVSAQLKDIDNKYQTYAQAFSATSPTPPPISIDIQNTNLGIPGIVNPGAEEVEFIVNFQNTTDSILRDIVLMVKIDGEIYEPNSVIPEDLGVYLKDSGTIMWDSRRIPKLAILQPFEAGSTKFTLNIKDSIETKDYNDKNFTLNISANIKPNNIPSELSGIELTDSDETYLKLNSILALKGRIMPHDTTVPFSNSGPFPPKVGEKTTYLVALQLLNYYNDLENISLSTILPKGIDWEDSVWPASSNVTFSPLNGEILWQFDSLRAGTGKTSPVEYIVFKVSSIPSPTLLGNRVTLLGETKVTATDSFTSQGLSSNIRELKSGSSVKSD